MRSAPAASRALGPRPSSIRPCQPLAQSLVTSEGPTRYELLSTVRAERGTDDDLVWSSVVEVSTVGGTVGGMQRPQAHIEAGHRLM